MTEESPERSDRPKMTMADFLETHPPGSPVDVTDFHVSMASGYQTHRPDLQLHCDGDTCNGTRIFASTSDPGYITSTKQFFFNYQCRNCKSQTKTYALIGGNTTGDEGIMYKIGEFPSFGPPVPSRVISLVGPDRELFLKGRRSESQGLGIGAFAYYRRVLENQWHRLLGEIVRVAERTGTDQSVLDALNGANNETQFSTAVDLVKAAIPDMLRIDGHNPLTLLHKALSEGLHEESEEQCLALAQSIRVILTELADRASQALKDEAELRDAVSRLLNRKDSSE